MCGILGLRVSNYSKLMHNNSWKEILINLYCFSESRGKEASGIAVRYEGGIKLARSEKRASIFIKSNEFKNIVNNLDAKNKDVAIIGHARLVTNGDASIDIHNQPVSRDGITLIHNGIICNFEKLWKDNQDLKRYSDLDSEIIPAYLRKKIQSGMNIEQAIKSFYSVIEGDASLACLFEDSNKMVLTTNTGSIYYAESKTGSLVFASELGIMSKLLKASAANQEFKDSNIIRLKPHEIKIIELNQPMKIKGESSQKNSTFNIVPNLKRCTKCILPETFPGIRFDKKGVCNVCTEYVPFTSYGKAQLEELCAKHRKSDGTPDCIVAFSGGRDSSYALHYLKREMGMNPIAFTYDWGMVTDLARRNISRLCGKLGVENILVSADIPKKRENIRKNIEAWYKKPEIGMVTLFMAGDKEFFYHPQKIQKEMGINLMFFASNRLEQSGFKSLFCGVKESNSWYSYVPKLQKIKMVWYFLKNYIMNPAYINSSLLDTIFSFYCAYILKHDLHVFYDYIGWNEGDIMKTLKEEYNWEMASDTSTSWRIGDGTAAFYNYIYYKIAGFTEHDTFLSNQIRAGLIQRDDALKIAEKNNKPRFESIKEYANTIGINYGKLISTIERTKKLYVK